jgi:Tfp pilus assembly protein PilO
MEQLTRYRIPLLTALGALVVVVIVFVAWISPEGAKVSSLKAKQTQLASQQSHLQIELFSLRRDKAHMATNCAELTKDLTQIPGTPTVDDFFQQVSNLAVHAGDPNTPSIDVTQAQTSADGVKVVTVSLTLNGSYGQMMAFLKGLDSFPRLFTVNSIGINGGNVAVGGSTVAAGAGGYTLTLAGSIFYSAGQANVCSGAPAGATAS